MDSEIFELCKEVYERTGWQAGDWYYERTDPKSKVPLNTLGRATIGFPVDEYDQLCPLYTSDYLLEKLPEDVRIDKDSSTTYTASKFFFGKNSYIDDIGMEASSPLKALLKLVISLDNAGQLKGDK